MPSLLSHAATPFTLPMETIAMELSVTWPDTLIVIAITVVIAVAARWLINRSIATVVKRSVENSEKRAQGHAKLPLGLLATSERQRQRTETMGSLLRSIATFVIGAVAILTILSAIGVPLAPLLASAGVGGVALGFGAQSLVRDFLSGIFMIVEDQFGVGDFVHTGDVSGTVEAVSLRVTRIREATGVIWYVRNGEMVEVGNLSQGWSTAFVDIPVAYDENPQRVIEILTRVVSEFAVDKEFEPLLIDEPKVVGVESVAGGTMTMRIMAKTLPNEHWGVQRALRERSMEGLAEAGIRGPKLTNSAFDPDARS